MKHDKHYYLRGKIAGITSIILAIVFVGLVKWVFPIFNIPYLPVVIQFTIVAYILAIYIVSHLVYNRKIRKHE